MLANLGPTKHVLILRNHGVAVGESDIPRALFLLWTVRCIALHLSNIQSLDINSFIGLPQVQRACEVQCAAAALPGPNVALDDAVRRKCADTVQMMDTKASVQQLWFSAQVRAMMRKRGFA